MSTPKIAYVVTIGRTIHAFFLEQLDALAQSGFSVTVICKDDCNLREKLPETVRLLDVPIPRGVSFGGSLQALRQLTKIFRQEQFDLVQYSTPNAAFLASVAAKRAGVPVRNYHIMGYRFESEHGLKRTILKAFEQIACRNSTHIECVCASTRRNGVQMGLFPEEKAVVVGAGSTGGVNRARFDLSKKARWRAEIRNQFEIPEDAVVFGFVGRITRDKGVNELFSAYLSLVRRLQAEEASVPVLLMIGPEEQTELLDGQLLAQVRQLSTVKFAGQVSDVERYFAALDVLVLPSYREGFGNVLIEAETMGVCCIASDIDGPHDAMRSGETGILVPPQDAQALEAAMGAVLEPTERETYSSQALVFSQRFDSKTLCTEILKRKRELLSMDGEQA